MTEIRPLHDYEMIEAITLANSIFRDAEQVSMADAFPLVFSENLGQSFGAFEDGKLVAFMGLVPAQIRVGASQFDVYSLGAVCTHPDYRGKGYAGQILDQIKVHISQTGASLLLVSGDRPLYIRAHCYQYSTVKRYLLDPQNIQQIANLSDDITIRELGATDWFKLHQVASARFSRYEQSISELASMIRAQAYASCVKLTHRTLVAEQNGQLIAFAVVSVPTTYVKRRPPFVVEYGGDPRVVASLLKQVVTAYNLDRLDAAIIWHDDVLHESLSEVPFEAESNYGTVHIVNSERFLTELQPYLNQANAEAAALFNLKNLEQGKCQLTFGEQSFELEPQELVSLIFDTEPNTRLPVDVKQSLATIFPLPFPLVSGLNYV
ncbi:GNAT family N-acetyltransferase [Paenibacillus sp. N1-5-1-14]|uniref:GNAT family N-acetyltransferase n=1 Tax=Paenibacillus radicibacter TaxID=2972488 RepID=UPI00215985AD|nr:GNAT family N-acetyltransferase [Paenibacillus radicibacter]MCR8645531.1 GNAT family N-acetyltransferase [Paenibacillus radicibacter]